MRESHRLSTEKGWGNMKKICWMLMLILVISLAAAGCGKEEDKTESSVARQEGDDGESISIGMSFDSFVIERWVRDRDVFVATAKNLGASVNVQNANGSVKEQISQIEYLISKGIDVLVVIPVDCSSLKEVIGEAKKAGISVISYERLLLDSAADLYISFDNEVVGRLMGQALKDSIPEGGEIFMLQGPEEDNNVQFVRKGFLDELEGSGLEIVYKANCEGWLAEKAAEYLDEALEQYPDVKGIMCGNDDIASQVVRVLTENRMAGKVQVVGQDGDLAACQRIVEGTQTMTAFKSVESLAEAAAEFAVRMAQGDPLNDVTETITDGTNEIPFSMLMPVAVTGENMDEIIVDGGFHSREDVYLNVADDSSVFADESQ